MKLEFKLSNSLRGGLIYALGDTAAALISDQFYWFRLAGVFVIGASIYALEIPNYFKWIDLKIKGNRGIKYSLIRAAMAMLHFNPFWIARHILFIKLFMGQYDDIGWGLVAVGFISFLINIPISLVANYTIQNKISLKYRFLASAIFSGLMAVYYSLSEFLLR
jgi:hypothetical protein